MNSKKFIALTAFLVVSLLSCVAVPIIKIDPFIHYHFPLEKYEYKMDDPWYINYGIIKNYDYDAMIIGTSMTANFKASEFNELFEVNSIKVPFEGASFNELGKAMTEACNENESLKAVLCGLDMASVYLPAEYEEYSNKPEYLYDDLYINDIPYIFNKEVLVNDVYFNTIDYTRWGQAPDFDNYRAWYPGFVYNKEEVLRRYTRPEKSDTKIAFTEDTRKMVQENIILNLAEHAQKNPDITFYYFYTPYSILYYDDKMQRGHLEYCIDSFECATETLLEYENIKLYSFCTDFNLICDFNNYKDFSHYGHHINTNILHWIKSDIGLLTKDNYKQHFEDMRTFYLNYDYDSIFTEASEATE